MIVKIAYSSKRIEKRHLFDHILPQSSKAEKLWSSKRSRGGGVSTLRVRLTQAQSGEPKQRHWYLTQELRFQV